MEWNPEKYMSHETLHAQPIIDLVNAIHLLHPQSAIDLGCGPGNSADFILQKWHDIAITGIDSSSEMLNKAQNRLPQHNWIECDIEDITTKEQFDIVFSCAALQWLPRHETLLPKLWEMVKYKGVLAIQMPANQDSPLHRTIFSTAQTQKWKSYLGDSREELYFYSPIFYMEVLKDLTSLFQVWETIYYHPMDSVNQLVDWAKNTVMRPFLNKLPSNLQLNFVQEVANELTNHYPAIPSGQIIYSQKRLFLMATK